MRVYTDTYGEHGDGKDVIVVQLDSGAVIGSFCIVEDPKRERLDIYNMIRSCIAEALAKQRLRLNAELETMECTSCGGTPFKHHPSCKPIEAR